MSNTVEIILFSIVIGIGCTFFGAAIVLAIQFHYRRNPSVYINQYNAHPTINYVIPQQPPMARICTPVFNNRLAEIHKLPHLSSQWTEEDVVQTSEESISEVRITSHPRTPSLSSQPSPVPPALPPMLFDPPLPYPLQTLPNDFTDSRWSRAASEGPPPPTQFQPLMTMLGMSTQQNPLLLTQMTSGILLHSAPSFLPENRSLSPIQPILSTQVSSNGTTQYPAPHEGESPMKEGTHPLSGHLLSDLHGDRSTSIMREQLSAPGSLRHPDLGDGQAREAMPVLRNSPLKRTSTEFPEGGAQNHPSPHHDTPPWALP